MSRGVGAGRRNDGSEQRIAVDPRRAFRDRKERVLTGELEARQLSDAPPGLLDGTDPPPRALRKLDTEFLRASDPTDGFDPYQDALRLQARPGSRKRSRTTRVRVYHRLERVKPGAPERCWAFTLTRAAWERLLTDRIFDSDGATYPDGSLVVPMGTDPLYVPVHCGTCGTHSVECLQIEFFEDG